VRQALQLAEPDGKAIPFVGTLLAYMSASMVSYELGELDEAEAILTRCNTQAAKFGSAEVQLFALSWLGRLCLARHDVAGAAKYDEEVEALLQSHAFSSSIMAYVDYNRFQLFLKQENLQAAVSWVASQATQAGALNPYAFRRLASPQLLIAQGKFSAATERLSILIEEARSSGHGSLYVKALSLQALALWASGDSQQALKILEQALMLAEPQGFCRAFVDEGEPMASLLRQARQQGIFADYVDRLLSTFAEEARAPEPESVLPEPLSERELEVLQLAATGASNKAIAAELFIAVSTVKKHMGNILVKLDTQNRVQAAARARELDLLRK
jgi:LuxR family maltose regulon positive regulatory protein